ncbi:MAG: hypothetical protein K9L30_13275 [Desulfobacterales bacterium]|nr:hypothetical protein [Desulfobacterales bacterium]
MKKWKCTVCNYIHTGDEPPDICPVCGADKSKFSEVIEEKPDSVNPETTVAEKDVDAPSNILIDLILSNHLHPISVHIPNGVLPVAVFFMFFAALFHAAGFEKAAFYNLIFVLISMPFVLFTGYIEWKKRYNSALTRFFIIKIGCAGIVLLMLLIIILWRILNPDAVFAGSAGRWIFLLFHIVMLGAAGIAGHLGGKLVFGKSDEKS